MSKHLESSAISCDAQREDYLFGWMDAEEEASFEEHMRSCTACQTKVAEHRAFSRVMAPPQEEPAAISAMEHHHLLEGVWGGLAISKEPEHRASEASVTTSPSHRAQGAQPVGQDLSFKGLSLLGRVRKSLGISGLEGLWGSRWTWGGVVAASVCLLWVSLGGFEGLREAFFQGPTHLTSPRDRGFASMSPPRPALRQVERRHVPKTASVPQPAVAKRGRVEVMAFAEGLALRSSGAKKAHDPRVEAPRDTLSFAGESISPGDEIEIRVEDDPAAFLTLASEKKQKSSQDSPSQQVANHPKERAKGPVTDEDDLDTSVFSVKRSAAMMPEDTTLLAMSHAPSSTIHLVRRTHVSRSKARLGRGSFLSL